MLRDIFPDVTRHSYLIELNFTDAYECYSYIIRTFTYLTEILNKVELEFIKHLDRIIDREGKISFVKEEILFPLRQRIMDMQQMIVINQQGIVSLNVIRRNNKDT